MSGQTDFLKFMEHIRSQSVPSILLKLKWKETGKVRCAYRENGTNKEIANGNNSINVTNCLSQDTLDYL